MDTVSPPRFALRHLPLIARLVLALFLISVAIGYLSALVQLHFQDASPGNLLPSAADAENIFAGPSQKPVSTIERLLEADESLPFNGQGEMRAAFTRKSDNWKASIKGLAKEKHLDPTQAEQDLRSQRDGERLALLDWIHNGANPDAFKKDNAPLPQELTGSPLTEDYVLRDEAGKAVGVKIRSILTDRCFRCHALDAGGDAAAEKYPLNSYALLKPYLTVKETGGMSLTKLAETTHVHLLSFAMLYGLTGLILAFSTYPAWLRFTLAPLALLAQLVDISCWWLARIDRVYADVVVYTGGIVGAALFLQIFLSLFNLFGKVGKAILVVLILAGCLAGYFAKERIIDPYLQQEKAAAVANQ